VDDTYGIFAKTFNDSSPLSIVNSGDIAVSTAMCFW
jgi:hypothetical protein